MQSIIGLWDFQMCSVVFHLDVDSAFCVFIIMFLGAVTYHRLKYFYAYMPMLANYNPLELSTIA